VDPAGGDGDAQSIGNSVSNDGRWVAFWSDASNLVSGDTNGKRDIFVRDLQTNTTTLVSVGVGGAPADDINQYPSISGDGRFVAFQSWADNIVPGDTNGFPDIFVRDLKKGTTKLVSIDPPLGQANQQSQGSSISTDGRWIAFSSFASNLATGDSNNAEDVFLADRTTGAITLVSKVSNFSAPGTSNHPDVDADGGVVAFTSTSSRLVSGDANNAADVFTWTKARARSPWSALRWEVGADTAPATTPRSMTPVPSSPSTASRTTSSPPTATGCRTSSIEFSRREPPSATA